MSERLHRELAGLLGRAQVLDRPADLAAYGFDAFGASGDRHLPDAVVFPVSTEEVSGVLQICAGHGAPVVPRGAGTGYCGGAVASGAVILNLCRMSRVLRIDAAGQRIDVEAGVLTGQVHRAASAAGLYYPPDPGASTTSTIGGNVACNASGPHGFRYGTTADFLTGATAVLADGRIAQAGEEAGDTDFLRLLAASEGTLAVITEAQLRLVPAPAARATLAGTFDTMERAAEAVAELARARVLPAALEFMDGAAVAAVARTGVATLDASVGALLLVEVEGDAAATRGEAAAARDAMQRAGATHVETAGDPAAAAHLWGMRRAISAAVAKVMIGKVNEDVVVPRDRVAELVARARKIGADHDVPVVTFGHLGDGNLHATFLIDPRRPGDRARGDEAAADLFEVVLGMGGSLTGEHGVGTTKLPYLERQLGPDTVALMRRLKQTLDPGNLLNPGKKIPPPGEAAARQAPAPSSAAARSDRA